jgi:hypothetical protein
MPLIADTFERALLDIEGSTNVTIAQMRHASAFQEYMEGLVTLPLVPSFVHEQAATAMSSALAGQHLAPPAGIVAINAGYLAYVGVVLAYLATLGWIPSIPPIPTGPIDVASVTAGLTSTEYVARVHGWVTAISGSIPPVAPVRWS